MRSKYLFVFAHPDDETFLCGGTISQLSQAGHQIKLICATKGEAGLVGNPELTTQDKLGEVRTNEQAKAAKILGISQIYYLGYLDGQLNQTSPKKLADKILQIFRNEKPDIVITFDKTGVTNHPDHIVISKTATKAFKKYFLTNKKVQLYYVVEPKSRINLLRKNGCEYDAFGKVGGVKDSRITKCVNIEKSFNIKLRALNAHKTQHLDVERYLTWCQNADMKKEHFQLVLENNL